MNNIFPNGSTLICEMVVVQIKPIKVPLFKQFRHYHEKMSGSNLRMFGVWTSHLNTRLPSDDNIHACMLICMHECVLRWCMGAHRHAYEYEYILAVCMLTFRCIIFILPFCFIYIYRSYLTSVTYTHIYTNYDIHVCVLCATGSASVHAYMNIYVSSISLLVYVCFYHVILFVSYMSF